MASVVPLLYAGHVAERDSRWIMQSKSWRSIIGVLVALHFFLCIRSF